MRRVVVAGAIAVHIAGAIASLAVLVFAAAWGVVEYARGRPFTRTYDRILWTAQVLLLVQVAAGIAALVGGREPASSLHIVLGSAACVLLPVVWWGVRGLARPSLAMGGASLAVVLAGAAAALSA
jgi:hypothetical protein